MNGYSTLSNEHVTQLSEATQKSFIPFLIFGDLNISMNKLLLLLSLGLIITGCSKSSVSPIKGLSGTYVDYKSIDTAYSGQLIASDIQGISIQTTSGDTLMMYPGTANAKTYYNVGGYDPKSVTEDTLRFTSGNAAVETNADTDIPTIKFTYDLKAGTYNDGLANCRERIVRINSTTIEMISNEQQGYLTGNVMAIYYRKQ